MIGKELIENVDKQLDSIDQQLLEVLVKLEAYLTARDSVAKAETSDAETITTTTIADNDNNNNDNINNNDNKRRKNKKKKKNSDTVDYNAKTTVNYNNIADYNAEVEEKVLVVHIILSSDEDDEKQKKSNSNKDKKITVFPAGWNL